MSLPSPEAVARYAAFWAELRSETTGDLRGLARVDMRFSDPFNEIVGVERIVAMLDHMLDVLDRPCFVIVRQATGDTCAFYGWRLEAAFRGRPLAIVGASEVVFDAAGLVAAHTDHFDAGMQVYARLPLLGRVLRMLRARLAFEH